MIKKLIPFVLLAVAIASAQSGQRIAQATQNVNGFVKVVSGASVTVCTYPSCNAVIIYSDPGLSAPIQQPLNADSNGNYQYYVTQGNYLENVSSPGTEATSTLVSVSETTANFSSPPPIGNVTPNTGAFTTLSASGGITGNLTGNVTGNVSGSAGTVLSLSSPPTIGNVTPNTGAFTTLNSAGGALNGTVGATTPNTGVFTTLSASSTFNVGGIVTLSSLAGAGVQCLHASNTGVVTGTGVDCGSGSGGGNVTGSSLTNNAVVVGSTGSAIKVDGQITSNGAGVLSALAFTAPLFASTTANVASTGTLRLANTDNIAWRNNANSGNLLFDKDASDKLRYNGYWFLDTSNNGYFHTGNFSTGVTLSNNALLSFTDTLGGNPYFNLQNDNNFVFQGTNASGGIYNIFSVAQHQTNPQFYFSVPLTALQGISAVTVGNGANAGYFVKGAADTSGWGVYVIDNSTSGTGGGAAIVSTTATNQPLFQIYHNTSAYTGPAINVQMASGSGSFASGDFMHFYNNGVSKANIDSTGALGLQGNLYVGGGATFANNGHFIGNLAVDNTLTANTVVAKSYNTVLQVDQYCTTLGTLDGTCLTNALAACPSTGCELMMPEGTITATTAQLPITVSKPVYFHGRSWDDTIVTTSDRTNDIFYIPSIGDVIFRDFQITRSGCPSLCPTSGAGIEIGIGQHILIDHMLIKNQYNNLNISGDAFWDKIDNSEFSGAINDGIASQCEGLMMSDNLIIYNGGNGYEITGAGSTGLAKGNSYFANRGFGIWYHISSARQSLHIGDGIDSSGNVGVQVSGTNGFTFSNGFVYSSGVTFSGTTPLYGAGQITNKAGIVVDNSNSQFIIINGNVLSNNGGEGIYCSGCQQATIANNLVNFSNQANAGSAGIRITDGASAWANITLNGNNSIDIGNGTSGYRQAYGLQISGGSGGNIAGSGNIWQGGLGAFNAGTISATQSWSGNNPTNLDNNKLGSGAPAGACRSGTIYTRTDATGGLYVCVNSAWAAVTIL